jgi:uncharacterized membrane protein
MSINPPMEAERKYLEDEIRKEFQLERMILFSDAVFAIIITLMAIEIHLPETEGKITGEQLRSQIFHLLPVIVAYMASFLFIGQIWYRHLHIFSLIKDFDKGLVVRNLVMLFFIGFFPFSASLFAKVSTTASYMPIGIYFFVIFACSFCQLQLQHYVLVKRPNLRINCDIHTEMVKYRMSRMVMVVLSAAFLLVSVTYYAIPDPHTKPFASWWLIPMPLVIKLLKRRIKGRHQV